MSVQQLEPVKAGTIFEVILEGDSNAERRGDRTPVIVSNCEYRFGTDADLDKCIAMLKQSDQALARQQDRKYDWQFTMASHSPEGGGIIRFSVSWYDETFFAERRDVFAGDMHRRMYNKIGITSSDLTVTHWRAI